MSAFPMPTMPLCDLRDAAAALPRPQPIPRPTDVGKWSRHNLGKIPIDPKPRIPWLVPTQFEPSNASDPAAYFELIRSSQFRPRCDRFLLFEDDLKGQGFGITAEFLSALLLIALADDRVLMEVPLNTSWRPLGGHDNTSEYTYSASSRYTTARTGLHRTATQPRWCSSPPYTLACHFAPWSHCDLPDEGTHVAPPLHKRWPFVMVGWPRSRLASAAVRIKLSWLYASWYLWQASTPIQARPPKHSSSPAR